MVTCFDMSYGFRSYFALSYYFVVRLFLVIQPDFRVNHWFICFHLLFQRREKHLLDVWLLVFGFRYFFSTGWSVMGEDRGPLIDLSVVDVCCPWSTTDTSNREHRLILVIVDWYSFETYQEPKVLSDRFMAFGTHWKSLCSMYISLHVFVSICSCCIPTFQSGVHALYDWVVWRGQSLVFYGLVLYSPAVPSESSRGNIWESKGTGCLWVKPGSLFKLHWIIIKLSL